MVIKTTSRIDIPQKNTAKNVEDPKVKKKTQNEDGYCASTTTVVVLVSSNDQKWDRAFTLLAYQARRVIEGVKMGFMLDFPVIK